MVVVVLANDRLLLLLVVVFTLIIFLQEWQLSLTYLLGTAGLCYFNIVKHIFKKMC